MSSSFRPATRSKVRGKIAIDGPSGSGKSFTALRLAFLLGKRVAVINTESGAVEKYLGLEPDGVPWRFDVAEPRGFSPDEYTRLIIEADKAGYDVIVVDSLSHAWEGTDGVLEAVDKAKGKNNGNSFAGWKDVTPMHRRMVDAILAARAHLICTMRTKTEWIVEKDERGKSVPRKIGTKPIQREGMEYEFDLYLSLDWSHACDVSKTRCPSLDGKTTVKPGAGFFQPFKDWLEDGAEVSPEHYQAKQEEIAAQLAKQEAEARAALPEMTPQEKMAAAQAKRAAKAAGTPGTITTTPPAVKSGPVVLCSDEQAEDVRGLLNAVFIKRGRPVAEGVKFLQSIGGEVCVRAMMLTPEDATQAIERLKNMLAQGEIITDTLGHQGAGTTANSPAAAQPTSGEKAESTPARTTAATVTTPTAQEPPFDVPAGAKTEAVDTKPAMASAVQVKAIRDLVAELKIPHDVQEKNLQKRGVNSFNSLTAVQADEMVATLKTIRDKKVQADAEAAASAKK